MLKCQNSANTNIPVISSRAVLLMISHSPLLAHPRLSLYISLPSGLPDFIFSLGVFPPRFSFFSSFKHLPSAVCFLPNKQPESSEPEGCSAPTSHDIVRRKRQKEERSHFRKAKSRSEEGTSSLCGEERTHGCSLGGLAWARGHRSCILVLIPEPILLPFPLPDIIIQKPSKEKSFCLAISVI